MNKIKVRGDVFFFILAMQYQKTSIVNWINCKRIRETEEKITVFANKCLISLQLPNCCYEKA